MPPIGADRRKCCCGPPLPTCTFCALAPDTLVADFFFNNFECNDQSGVVLTRGADVPDPFNPGVSPPAKTYTGSVQVTDDCAITVRLLCVWSGSGSFFDDPGSSPGVTDSFLNDSVFLNISDCGPDEMRSTSQGGDRVRGCADCTSGPFLPPRVTVRYPTMMTAMIAGEPTASAALDAPQPLPCVHEGPVATACTGCGPGAELRHVRQCLHDDGPDLCVRGASADPAAVRSCGGCPLREAPAR